MRNLTMGLWLGFGLLFFAASAIAHTLTRENSFEARLRAAELAGDRAQVSAICREWYASGQYSPGLLNWNYNALMSVEENGLLFTARENDTYPAFLLQFALDVRADVTVLNLQWLENPEYRDLIARSRAFPGLEPGGGLVDFVARVLCDNPSPAAGAAAPVYFGVMCDKNLLRADKAKLYLTGLALKFSQQPFDNVAVLRYNFENRFRTDYLDLNLEPETQPETVAQLNLNYIPALVLLHRHYSAAGEAAKAERAQNLALRIARAGGREPEVQAYFGPQPPATGFISAIKPKMLEKPMRKIGPKLYAAEAELSNEQYDLFLQDLVKNRDYDQLQQCLIQKTDWRSLLADSLRNLPDAVLFANGHPDSSAAPVQNIRFEAAQRYCSWITQVYNSSNQARRSFKKVVFRLPTQSEWELAASGGLPNEPYPWPGGYYVRNSKGCYLLNLNATKDCVDCPNVQAAGGDDGAYFPAPVTSYFPNKFGLYNVSGNVAEMTLEPGICKGGSWQDEPYRCQIRTVGHYTAPSPAVGFRVFMEVIEE